ncbi:amino acid ABC transporter permease [Desulfoplanes formicivorans]|uniref:Polar amino acid ABC transporter permease n=1 Tax=Desulfoplanes formicivorans TaxID=1592317 RepID=A0A194AFG5_9BACT|nr:amino acid ABC transporter permease [Desulfoplanes formicivorans]GAU07831.1 polar amino acid ABC transporter permease [Desulfoplanes formicivorans]
MSILFASLPSFSGQAFQVWITDLAKFFGVLGLLTWLIVHGSADLGYNWQWYQVPRYLFTWNEEGFTLGPLLTGLIVTLKITGWSLVFAFAIALTTAMMRLSGSFMARSVSRVYLEFIRNTPLLIQIFFLYFVISPIIGLDRFAIAVLALSLFEGAYASEIFRAGIRSIPKGQWEAGYSLGMTSFDLYRLVILPQTLRRIAPPLTSQGISLIKDSALVSTIAVYDLTMQGQAIIADSFLTFEIWFTVAAIYLVLTGFLSLLVTLMQQKTW